MLARRDWCAVSQASILLGRQLHISGLHELCGI